MNNIDEELDYSFINKYKNEEQVYDKFYQEDMTEIKLIIYYVDKNNNLHNVKEDMLILDEINLVKRDNLITIIKCNQLYNNIKYKLISILKFNIDLKPEGVNDFNSSNNDNMNNFFHKVKFIRDIKYCPTISMFKDLNRLYFIFLEEV